MFNLKTKEGLKVLLSQGRALSKDAMIRSTPVAKAGITIVEQV